MFEKLKKIKETMQKRNSIDFRGKFYFDYTIKLFFLFLILECLSITLITQWGVNIFLKLDAHIYSFLLFGLCGFLVLFLSNSQRISFSLLTLFYLFVGVVSALKIQYVGMPLMLSDVHFLSGANTLLSFVSFKDIFNLFSIYPWLQVVCYLLIALFLVFSKKRKIRKELRIRGSVICSLCIFILCLPVLFTTMVSTSWTYTNVEMYYVSMGLPAGLYGKLLNEQIKEPSGYDEELVQQELSKAKETTKTSSWGTPNVIYVLSEAYWDLDHIEEVQFDKDIMLPYRTLKENESQKIIQMLSPTYAGVTANVEFELLTGMSLSCFDPNFIAAHQLFNKESTRETYPTITKTLKDNGYHTFVYSPMDDGTIYNLKHIYSYLGFEDIYFYDDIYEDDSNLKGNGLSDNHILSRVIEDIKSEQQPYFCYVKTIQNHMPYNADKYENFDVNIIESSLGKEENLRINIYAQGIYDVTNELDRLYKEIQILEEPTILVYFGDHLPSLLTASGEDIVSGLNYSQSSSLLESNFKKHNTEAIILSNYDLNINDEVTTLGFDNLSPYVLSYMDLDKESVFYDYFSLLNTYSTSYAGGNHTISFNQNGNLVDALNRPKEMEETYDLREQVQYYFLTREEK